MKNRRAMLWLAIALFLTLGAHFLLSYKLGVRAALVQRTSLLDQQFSSPSRIAISRDGRQDAVLARMTAWRLVEPFAASTDERAVLKMIDLLSTCEIEDTLSDQELERLGRSREDFGLDAQHALRVAISAADATTTILFGLPTPIGDGVYAAVDGEDAVYVVTSNAYASVNLDADSLRCRTLLPDSAGPVSSFDLKRGSGAFMRFMRDGDTWKMTEPRKTAASAAKIRKMLGDIASAEASDFVWPTGAKNEGANATVSLLAGYGLDPESAVTITMKCADGSDQQVSFGKEAKDGKVYALLQNAGAIATVPATLKDQALAGVAEFTDSRLFPFEPSAAARISIMDGHVSYLLAKGEDGSWRLDAPVAAPTDQETVDALLERLFALTSADLAPPGVEDWSISVSISTDAQPSGASQQAVSILRSSALGSIRLESLRSREIFKIDAAAVKRLVVSGFRGPMPTSIVYDKDRRAWNVEKSPVGGSVNVPAVEAAIETLSPLVADGIVKLKVSPSDLRRFGLENPRVTIAVDQDREDSLRRNILIGDALESGGVYATLGATEAVFILPERTVRRLEAPLVRKE